MRACGALQFCAFIIGLVITVGVLAFLWGASGSEREGTCDELGVSDVNGFSRSDELAIEITWTAPAAGSTSIVQRSLVSDGGSWIEIATIGSDMSMRAVYVDAHVEHLVTYYYRLHVADTANLAVSQVFAVTAVKSSS